MDHPVLWVYLAHGSPVLQPFLGNILRMCLRCAASEVQHLVFGCYVINECCDIICDITVPHMHQSHDPLL